MNILLILQLAVTLLLNVSTNQAVTVEQKQQALSFAAEAVQLANSYITENASSTGGGDSGAISVPFVPPSIPPIAPPVNQTNQPTVTMPTFTVEILESVSSQGGMLKFKVTDSNGKPVIHINHVESPLTYQNFNGLGEDSGIYQIYIPDQVAAIENPTLNVTVNSEEVKAPVILN